MSDTESMKLLHHQRKDYTNVSSESDIMEHNSAENKKKKPMVSTRQLFRFATRREKWMIGIAMTCSIVVGLLQPASIAIFGLMVNQAMDAFDQGKSVVDATRPIALMFVYLGTGILVLAYIGNALWIISGESQTRRIRQLYVHAILRQDMAWFDKAEQGSFTSRLAADAQLIQDGISEKFGAMVRALSAFVFGILMSFGIGWRMEVVILAVLPLLATAAFITSFFTIKGTTQAQDAYADAGAIAEQVFAGIRTVYSFSLQNRFAKIYGDKLVKVREAGIRRGFVMAVGSGSFLFIMFGIYGLAFWYGAKLAMDGTIDAGFVMAIFLVMILGGMSLLQMPTYMAGISTARGAAYKIFETIDRVPDIDIDLDEGERPSKVFSEIEFRNVQFRYPTRPDVPILKNLNLKIKPGMTVAFVGPSGSGKSTSIQLLQRFYDPLAGEVLLDGRNIKDLSLR